MKRLIYPILAFSLLLTGCGGNVSTAETVKTFQTEPPETTATTEPTTEPPLSPAELRLNEMSLHEKVCQLFITAPSMFSGSGAFTTPDEAFLAKTAEYPLGGFIMFEENIADSEQTKAMISALQNDAMSRGTGIFTAVDEEGGTVARVQNQLGTEAVNDMSYYGSLDDAETVSAAAATIGTYLNDYGFNLDFAPVADVNISPYNELGSRIFSTDPVVVAEMSGAFVAGLKDKGVCPTLKHFPGLGAAGGNTHYGSVTLDRTHEELTETEFTAFAGGISAGADFVMVGHQIVPCTGDELPADLSPVVVNDWLRGELGFNGLAITDSHSMGAITNVYSSSEAAILAIEAGIDIILMPDDITEAVDGLEQAVTNGRISEKRIDQSVSRILTKKAELGLIK